MNVLIYRTSISNQSQVVKLNKLLQNAPRINKWTVDLDDIDKVLRMETDDNVKDEEILDLLNSNNLHCEVLSDEILFI